MDENVDPALFRFGVATAGYTQCHEALPAGAIRLLVLLPGRYRGDIRCETVDAYLQARPRYEAVSYTWSSSYPSDKLILNGIVLYAGGNLVKCLRRLRRKTVTRTLWVDALCINQADMIEKSAQIQAMPQIYASATATMIWLGEDEYFHAAGPDHAIVEPDDGVMEELTRQSNSLDLLHQLAQNRHLAFTRTAVLHAAGLATIFGSPWFSRMWVVQETLLSESAHLVLGRATLPWRTVLEAVANLVAHSTTCCRPSPVRDPRIKRVLDKLSIVIETTLSYTRVPLGTRNELLANLWMFRSRHATLPHDKIYGILGLVRETGVNIIPDYGKSFTSLSCTAVLEDIRISGNLHALRGSRTSSWRKRTMKPSWCTNWYSFDYWAEDRSRVLTEIYVPMYSASGAAQAQIVASGVTLSVAGKVFDKVRQTKYDWYTRFEAEDEERWQASLEWLRDVRDDLRNCTTDGSYIAGGSVFNAFWRTLQGDCVLPHREGRDVFHNRHIPDGSKKISSVRRATAKDLLAFLLWWLSAVGGLNLSKFRGAGACGTTQMPPARLSAQIFWTPAVLDVHASIIRATSGRCMFLTEKGYVGLGPESMKPGDQVAILLGGTTPFVLRNTPGSVERREEYEMIGDCYVHGVMDGELAKDVDTDSWPKLVLV